MVLIFLLAENGLDIGKIKNKTNKMKELNLKTPDKIENVKQVSIEKQTVFIGSSKPIPGHTTFEVNYQLKTITKAAFDKPPAVKFEESKEGVIVSSKKITIKPNCVYISALNKKKRNQDIKT